ncbi:hypothetical protein E0H26_28005 [Micromonospora zingiberis]|uniref:Uncharacterized protein n=1 Tax=Micromonospora zingiberis TaxID=2053011 RepID=A0A4R0G0T7_9ACTN|nr:hypothetical protein E0H26_28005 [Micromonospora zingiberis]
MSRASAYIDWFYEARRQLRNQVRPFDFERLLSARSFEVVLATTATFPPPGLGEERLLNGLISTEMTERADTLRDRANRAAYRG